MAFPVVSVAGDINLAKDMGTEQLALTKERSPKWGLTNKWRELIWIAGNKGS